MEKTRGFVHQLLQVVDRHVLEVNLLSTVDVGGIGKNANRHPWPGDVRESVHMNKISVRLALQSCNALDRSRETLVPLGIVIFQTDLELNGLDKVAVFFSRGSKEFLDRAPHA